MKTKEVTLRYIEANEGHLLRSKKDNTIISDKIWLSLNDSIENWEEVEEDIARLDKEKLLQEIEENLKNLVNNTVE